MTNNFTLGVDENDIEIAPEEMINEELLELEQEHMSEELAREKETIGKNKKQINPPTPQIFTVSPFAQWLEHWPID